MPIEKLEMFTTVFMNNGASSVKYSQNDVFNKINELINQGNKVEAAVKFLAEEVSVNCVGIEEKKFLLEKVNDILK